MYLAYIYLWFSFLHLLLKSVTTSLILSITLDCYFTFVFISPPHLPSSLIGMSRGPTNGEMVPGNGWLFSESHNWVRNKPPNISWTLESCFLPILSGLEACLSLAKARHSFKWHIAEKSLSQPPEKKRDRGKMPPPIWNLALSAFGTCLPDSVWPWPEEGRVAV